MALESVTYITDLVNTNPVSNDPKSEGDDHIRNIKTALGNTFPNFAGVAMTCTEAELNLLDGVTALASSDDVIDNFPAGTIMAFQQTNAPTGWTKEVTHNNKSLRVVTGTASSGGATAFTSVFGSGKTTGSHTLTSSQIPAHSHKFICHDGTEGGGSSPWGPQFVGSITTSLSLGNSPSTENNTGGGSGHTHTLSLDLQYVDIILAAKD